MKKIRFEKSNLLLYAALLVASIMSCVIRYPDFETALWSASDTNYQCLMNAKAMLEADEDTVSWMPLITFPEETDYGLEYSSGAFDKKTGKYFYYISFPAFPFLTFKLFLKITGLPVNEVSMYVFCSILFCISAIVVVRLFITIFGERLSKYCVAFITGITYLFSVEIMHSMGLTYWGQNWYMIFFPVLCMSFFRIENADKPQCKEYILYFLIAFFLLQTEWSAYFALFAFWVISLIRVVKKKDRKYLYLVMGMAAEVSISVSVFVFVRAGLVGFSEFVRVVTQRSMGRIRITDYSVFAVEKSLIYSFGSMLLLMAGYGIWVIIYKAVNREKISWKREYISILFLFFIPLFENHLFTNHALTYSMDRMKWYFMIHFVLLFMISELISYRCAKIIIYSSSVIAMGISLFLYLFIENDYQWNDTKLKASRRLEEYIEENYADNILGQLGDNSVWGYSKILFGHGITKETSIDTLIERADKLHKRYAVALNDLDLSYTQKWYSSAIIYDLFDKKYIIAGSLRNQYLEKIDDFVYLNNSDYVDLYVNDYHDFIKRIDFPNDSSIEEKEKLVEQFVHSYGRKEDIIYFITNTEDVSRLIVVDNQNLGEWHSGISTVQNRLIFLNTDGNKELLMDAKVLSANEVSSKIINIFTEGDFIYIDLETDNLSAFSYPNTIIIGYEED